MKRLALVGVLIFMLPVFFLTGCGKASGQRAAVQQELYYCPMHSAFTLDKPGSCAICGMDLVKKTAKPVEQTIETPGKASGMAPARTLGEICVMHRCGMKNCPMMKAHLKPGERIVCPVCGEVIADINGKVVEIQPAPFAVAGKSAGTGQPGERKIIFYRNPMTPDVTSPVPMKDSMGMDYVPVYAGPQNAPGGKAVQISPERQQMIGVKTEVVTRRELAKTIRATGRIAYDPELAVTQEEFIQALKALDNLKDSPLADVVDQARNLTAAARNKLKLLGMSEAQIAILEQTKQGDAGLYSSGQTGGVFVYMSVYEYEIGMIKLGDVVEIQSPAYPGETFPGAVVGINPVLDPATRTNQVRVKIADPEHKLKPEMYVNATIQEKLGMKLAVPASAVLDTGIRQVVYLSQPDNVLESQEVVLGQKAGDYYEVISGLKEGDAVVTSGNFLVDAETKLKGN
ncbi:MAG: efflux RND transporter periplasmic adaptor subunit [Candidatus Omnitrophica bacterium]|nr:efflux RND transporter periplasmic adaptor subunit [Candidatus Omnitrophota bacterium]